MIRIIPRLDIKGPNLVKGIHLEGLRVLGSPIDFARYYYEHGADELLFQDVVASLYERNSLTDIIQKTAREIFIPLTVGGGIRTLEDIKVALRSGADKVSINTAAIKNPEFIKKAAREFGSSTICIALEIIQQQDGTYLCYTDNGREYTGIKAIEWAKRVVDLGAGELIITAIDKEGTKNGMDVNLIKSIVDQVSIPVIAHGGVGKVSDISKAVDQGADAVSLATMLHYNAVHQIKPATIESKEGNREFLKKQLSNSFQSQLTLSHIKKHLNEEKIPCRY